MVDERKVAEVALGSLNDGMETDAIQWPSVASRVKAARQRLGISETELAGRLGMRPSEYWDIEVHDDEAFLVFSLSQLDLLSVNLGLTVDELLFGAKADSSLGRTPYSTVVERLAALIAREGVTVDTLGERVGWELGPVLSDANALGQFCVNGLRDVCQVVGVDWVSVLPRPK